MEHTLDRGNGLRDTHVVPNSETFAGHPRTSKIKLTKCFLLRLSISKKCFCEMFEITQTVVYLEHLEPYGYVRTMVFLFTLQ